MQNREDIKKIYLFEKMPVPKSVAALAVPTIISSLVMVIYSLADTWFVGLTDDPVQNAAVALAAPVLLAFNAINNLFGVGTSSMMSRALGRKDYDTVYKSSAFGFYCSLLFALIFSFIYIIFHSQLLEILGARPDTLSATSRYLKWTVALGAAPAILNVVFAYLVRSEGSALHASIGTMSGCLLNIVLDPIFVLPWGLGMGAEGAGLATFISNCVACLYFFGLLFIKRGRTYVCIRPSMFRLKKEIIIGICAVGIPASIQNLLNVTGMTILNNFTSSYGADSVAAMGIANRINLVPMYIALGLSQGVMPLISYNYANRTYKRAKHAIVFSSKISVGMLGLVTVVFYIFAAQLMGLFINNDTIISYGTGFLRGLCLSLPFMGMDFLAVAVFQACGIGRLSLLFAILRKIVLEIPFLFILNRLFPMYGLAYAQFSAEFILSISALIALGGIFRKLMREEP